jgi:uncharacterized membrane protein
MQFALSLLVPSFVALVGLWPLACLVVAIRHAVARRWRRVGQVALLLPLWTIAASVGAMQLGPLLAARGAAQAPSSPLLAATGVAVAVCLAAAAWLLLARSFDRRPSQHAATGVE